jgi:hypothetical protein
VDLKSAAIPRAVKNNAGEDDGSSVVLLGIEEPNADDPIPTSGPAG